MGKLLDRFEVRFGGQRDRVERAGTATDQPVRLDAGFEQRLEYAHAAGTTAASATQHEDQAARSFPGLRTRRAAPSPPGQHGRGSPEPSLGHRYYV